MSEERETCQDTIAAYYAEGGEGAGQLGAPTIMRTSVVRPLTVDSAPVHVSVDVKKNPSRSFSGVSTMGAVFAAVDYLNKQPILLQPGMPFDFKASTSIVIANKYMLYNGYITDERVLGHVRTMLGLGGRT